MKAIYNTAHLLNDGFPMASSDVVMTVDSRIKSRVRSLDIRAMTVRIAVLCLWCNLLCRQRLVLFDYLSGRALGHHANDGFEALQLGSQVLGGRRRRAIFMPRRPSVGKDTFQISRCTIQTWTLAITFEPVDINEPVLL